VIFHYYIAKGNNSNFFFMVYTILNKLKVRSPA